MIYGSVCSGIESATQAWAPLGWRAAFFSEIEKFPCAVLAHHYGSNLPGESHPDNGVPNYGDMTKYKEWPDHGHGSTTRIDVLVGGTPCQGFSIAGLRKGLDDPRGNLMLTYLAIARRYQPRWLVWENVPGVLSSAKGRDFATFIKGLEECGYHAAWRVFDAQYIRVDSHARAVPQRRRRVFVIGYLGDWRRAAAVLFERESLSGHPALRRKAGQKPAGTLSSRPSGGGGLGTDFDLSGGIVAREVSPTVRAGGNKTGGDRPMGSDVDTCDSMVAHTILGKNNSSHAADLETYIAEKDVSGTVTSKWAKGSGGPAGDELQNLVAHPLRGEGYDGSEDGTGRGTPIIPIAFDSKTSGQSGFGCSDEVSPTLKAMAGEKPNGGGQVAVAFVQNSRDEVRLMGGNGNIAGALADEPGAKQQTYIATPEPYTLAIRGRDGEHNLEYRQDGTANAILTPNGGRAGIGVGAIAITAQSNWAVRRLTPTECERLQGTADNYTRIAWRGKPPENCPDGPRYKAIGNAMAINVMRWLQGNRI